MDYASLLQLEIRIVHLFWRDVERHHPGIASLNLAPNVAAAWRERARFLPDGRERRNLYNLFFAVRSFYLDIAQWAAEDPAAWAAWVTSQAGGLSWSRRYRRDRATGRVSSCVPRSAHHRRGPTRGRRQGRDPLDRARNPDGPIDGVSANRQKEWPSRGSRLTAFRASSSSRAGRCSINWACFSSSGPFRRQGSLQRPHAKGPSVSTVD
jgi:hypothetical protein